MIIAFGVQQPKMERFVARPPSPPSPPQSHHRSRVVRWPHGNARPTHVTSRPRGLNVILLVIIRLLDTLQGSSVLQRSEGSLTSLTDQRIVSDLLIAFRRKAFLSQNDVPRTNIQKLRRIVSLDGNSLKLLLAASMQGRFFLLRKTTCRSSSSH
jgi:hypothetical protein